MPSPTIFPAAAFFVLASALPFAAVAADQHPAGIVVDDAWFATMPDNGPTYGYFHVTNHGDKPELLTKFSAAPCSTLKLEEAHGGGLHSKDAVLMTVAANTSVMFSRGGYHLVCKRKAASPSPGETVPVTITLHGGTTVPVSFAVRAWPR